MSRPTHATLHDPHERARSRRALGLAALIVLALDAAFYFRVLGLGEVFFSRDMALYHVPLTELVFSAWRSLELPAWNPYLFGGVPLAGEVSVAPYYPLHLVLLGLSGSKALALSVVLHHVLASLGALVLVRRLTGSALAGCVAGVCLGLCGYAVSMDSNPLFLRSLAWLPWALWAADRLAARQGSVDVVVLASLLAMQVLSGDVQTTYVTAWCGTAFAVLRAGPARKRRALTLFVAAGALALGLAAVQLGPLLETLLTSRRAGGLDAAEALSWSLHPLRVFDMFWAHPLGLVGTEQAFWGQALVNHPSNSQPWAPGLYLGFLPALLLVLALRQRAQTARYWAVLVSIGLLLALGIHTPAFGLSRWLVPLWSAFRYPEKLMALVSLALACGAGLGLAQALDEKRLVQTLRMAIWATGLAASLWLALLVARALAPAWLQDHIATLVGAPATSQRMDLLLSACVQALLPLGGFVLITWLCLRRLVSARSAALATAVLLAVDLFAVNSPLILTTADGFYTGALPLADELRQQQRDSQPFRVHNQVGPAASDGGVLGYELELAERRWSRQSLVADTLVAFDIAYAAGFGVAYPATFRELWQACADRPMRQVELNAIRFVLDRSDGATMRDPQRFVPRAVDAQVGVGVSEVRAAVPMFRVVYQALYAADHTRALDLVCGERFDPRRQLVLEGEGESSEQAEGGVFSVEVQGHGLRRWEVAVETSQPGFLMVAQTHAAGWRVTVDGESSPLLRANVAQSAIALRAGKHQVVMVYRPLGLRLGLLLSMMSAVASAMVVWRGRRRAV